MYKVHVHIITVHVHVQLYLQGTQEFFDVFEVCNDSFW